MDLASKVSVVLLTYNCAHRVREILDHLAQLHVPVIAVDNASTDSTRELLAEYPQFELIELPRNIGAAGRNVGAWRATTPYIAFCDDDGWFEYDGLACAVDLLDRYPRLGVVNARILVGEEGYLDPISVEMEQSPLRDGHGIPGTVLLGFMAGAVIIRASAYREAGGYDQRFFIGGEEETLAYKLARLGWQMRYVREVVMHHQPSQANAPHLRAYGMRNTLWNAWLHRRLPSALRWTAFTLVDTPKNRDYLRGLAMAVAGAGWVARCRRPWSADLDMQASALDRRRFARRRRWLTTRYT